MKKRNIVFSSDVNGTIAERLASMVEVSRQGNPNNLTWDVEPETYFHVIIQNENGSWLAQTHTTGKFGFYLGKAYKRPDLYDPNKLVKGQTYYLHFRNYNITIPFTR